MVIHPESAISVYILMHLHVFCYGFCVQAATKLRDASTNIKLKNGIRKNILPKDLVPGSDLVSFLIEGNCLGFGAFAAMLVRHSSVCLCGSPGITILRVAETFRFGLNLFVRQ